MVAEAVGSHDLCEFPEDYEGFGWESEVEAVVDYKRRMSGRRFKGYVGPDAGRRRFIVGNYMELCFIDRARTRTRYRVCVRFAADGRGPCFRRRTGAAGSRSATGHVGDLERIGNWTATWTVRGRTVARWRFHMGQGD